MSDDSLSRRQQIAEIYTQFGPLVARRCRYILKDPEAAEDATHEVFVRVMRSYETFRGESSPLAWILKIATNHCLNVLASKNAAWHKRYREQKQLGAEQAQMMGEDPVRAESVRRLLAKLDTETQQIAIHYYVDEMTQAEIAEAIGRSLPTIRKRLEKFRRVALKELGHEL